MTRQKCGCGGTKRCAKHQARDELAMTTAASEKQAMSDLLDYAMVARDSALEGNHDLAGEMLGTLLGRLFDREREKLSRRHSSDSMYFRGIEIVFHYCANYDCFNFAGWVTRYNRTEAIHCDGCSTVMAYRFARWPFTEVEDEDSPLYCRSVNRRTLSRCDQPLGHKDSHQADRTWTSRVGVKMSKRMSWRNSG